jgi:CheY-like chemotaxis protein
MIQSEQSSPAATALAEEQLPLAARCVRALMERHGVRKYRQSPWLADALGLSYSQAHRRMTGASPWTLEDLERVGALFGETLAELVAKSPARGSMPGYLKAGAVNVACQIWLGEVDPSPRPESLVAVNAASGWVVLPASETPEGATAYKVERFEAKPAAEARRLVAVLDDDPDVTDGLCAQLQASGYDARSFYRTDDLRKAAEQQRFDAFVIDWIVEDKTTQDLLAVLRHQNASAPIIVLTGQQLMGPDEDDIAHAVISLGLVFSEKPVRMSILSATLARAFLVAQQGR